MKIKKELVFFLCLLLLTVTGCEKKDRFQIVTSSDSLQDTAQDMTQSDMESAESTGIEEVSIESMPLESQEQMPDSTSAQAEIVVHICGAVNSPGVYTLKEKDRFFQAVEEAGGFTEDACQEYLNQAAFLSDGMQIYVPTVEEAEEYGFLPIEEQGKQEALEGSERGAGQTVGQQADGSVNINTASQTELMTLPGIGSGKAEKIISYREKMGAFQKIEDIKKVDGIKDGLFQKICDLIRV